MKATYTEFLRVSSRTVVSNNPPRARSITDSPGDLTADQSTTRSERARNALCTARGNRGRAKGEQVQNNTQRRLHTHSPRLPSVRAPNPNHGWMTTIMDPKKLRRPRSNLVASSMKTRSSECPWNLIIKFILKF